MSHEILIFKACAFMFMFATTFHSLDRKSTIYEMSWPKGLIEIGSSLVAIAPYGGPIGKNAFTYSIITLCIV